MLKRAAGGIIEISKGIKIESLSIYKIDLKGGIRGVVECGPCPGL